MRTSLGQSIRIVASVISNSPFEPAEVEDLLACMAAKKKVAEEEEAAKKEVAELVTELVAKLVSEAKAVGAKAVEAKKEAALLRAGERHFDEYMQWLSEMVGTFKSNGGLMHQYEQVLPGAPFDLSKVPHGRIGDVREYLTSLRRILSDLRRYVITSPEESNQYNNYEGNETPARTRT